MLGCPLLEQTTAPVEVAEGLADALALAARSPAPAVATLGTSGMSSTIIAEWLATSPATRVWADRDEAKAGRAPPGQRYGRELMRLVNDAGGNAIALHAPSPHKDPAAAAASMGFNDPGPAWREYARTLSENDGLPPVGDRQAGHRHLCGGSVMTMKGEPVPPEGAGPHQGASEMAGTVPQRCHGPGEAGRDPARSPLRRAGRADDIMPQIPELAEFPVPPGLKKYIDATRIVAGASVPTSAACSPPHSTSWLLRTSTFRAGRTLRIHPACTLSSARRAAGGRARRSGKPCRATWRPTNGWKSSTMKQTPTPKRAWSSEQRGSAPEPCGRTLPSRPCSAGCGRPAGPWRWPTATPRRSWAAGVSARTT